MAAYKIAMKVSCDEPMCSKRATFTVYNTMNSKQGQFCTQHADRRLKALHASEADMVRATLAARGDEKPAGDKP